jgi:hypothetical protein
MNKSARKAIVAISILMLLMPLSGALAQTTNPTWNKQIVDTYGIDPSLVLDSNGTPHVSYNGGDLRYASWNGKDWNIQIVDSGNWFSSLALDSVGNPHISYCSAVSSNQGLNYASWNGSAWHIQNVDPKGVISRSSLVLDSASNPHISYLADTGLKYANWTGLTWNIQTIDQNGKSSCLALDSNGNPHVSYYDSNLKYASWNGSTWSIQTVDSNGITGSCNSLVMDSSDNPHISYDYYDRNPFTSHNSTIYLKYVSWNGSGWNLQTADTFNAPFWGISLVLDSSENPHIGYGDYEGTEHFQNILIKYAEWNGSTWNTQTIDSERGGGVSLALDSNQNPVMCYSGFDSDGQLRYAYYGVPSQTPATTQITAEYTYALIIGVGVAIVILAVLLLQRKRRVKKQKLIP